MNEKKRKKSMTGPLLLILVIVFVVSASLDWSPLYYKKLIGYIKTGNAQNANSNDAGTTKTNKKLNTELREQLKTGGSISFLYNYIPSKRSWHTMYTYTIYRHQDSGDFTFYCTRSTYEAKYSGDLCDCLYSEQVWEELLSLILDYEELVDISSVYDENGMVTSDPIEKTISIAGHTYAPSNINAIEAYFKKLAINTGINASELDWNIRVDDDNILNKSIVTNLHGDFFINNYGGMSEDDNAKIETYLRAKYEETGIRMYVVLLNVDNIELLKEACTEVCERATSPAVAFGLVSSQKHWCVKYRMKKSRESALRDNYEMIADAFYENKKGTLYEKVIKAIDKAYELY